MRSLIHNKTFEPILPSSHTEVTSFAPVEMALQLAGRLSDLPHAGGHLPEKLSPRKYWRDAGRGGQNKMMTGPRRRKGTGLEAVHGKFRAWAWFSLWSNYARWTMTWWNKWFGNSCCTTFHQWHRREPSTPCISISKKREENAVLPLRSPWQAS